MTFFKALVALCAVATMTGCANKPPSPYSPPPEQVYGQIYREGGRDTIDLLRDGLRTNNVYGVTDPYVPMRTPEQVVPVWVPARVNTFGRRIEGHWEHTVIEKSKWYTQ
jgi:hypothetical protein